MGQDLYDTYNEDNEELLGNPPVSDRDRDERESLQEMNDKVQVKDTEKNIKNKLQAKQTTLFNVKKRAINNNKDKKSSSIPRVTAAGEYYKFKVN